MEEGAGVSDTFDPATVTWVMDRSETVWLIEAISTATEVIVDLETTGLDEHAERDGQVNGGVEARVVLASFTLPQPEDEGDPTTWVVPLSHPDSPLVGHWRQVFTELCQAMRAAGRPISNQNMKFDARWCFALTGVDLSHLLEWDSGVGAHLLDENSSIALKERVPAVFGVERWDDFDLKSPGAAEKVPMFDLGIYAARDTYWTWKWTQMQRHLMFLDGNGEEPEGEEEVEHARLGRLATWCAMPTVRTLTAMEQRGMSLDMQWVNREIGELEAEAGDLWEALVYRYPGLDPDDASFHSSSHWFRDWTQAAVDAGDLVVAELTPTGRPRWGKGSLKRQARHGSQTAQDLLDYRQRTKKLEYLRSWLGFEHDGKIFTTYNASGSSVATGRLSSSSPNMQQVTYALRPAFVASEGYVLADLDYSQIEMRGAAFISRCEPMLQAFRDGQDTHRMLAAAVTGKALESIEPHERQAAKAGNFGLLYGMGAYGFKMYADDAYDVVLTEQEAAQMRQTFFELWRGLSAWHERMSRQVQERGRVVSPIGRVRRVGGYGPTDDGGPERAGINSPVQGFASDIMQIAAASIEGMIPGVEPVRGARLVGTVHDSILIEVPQDSWAEVVAECQHRMKHGVQPILRRMGCDLDVPLQADAKVGTRWGLTDVGEM